MPETGRPGVARALDPGAVSTWVFDLDNTLYPATTDVFTQIDWRMTAFIAEYLDLDPVEARRVQKGFFHEHGTTLRGMMTVHAMAPEPFLRYVHDIDVTPVAPNPDLDAALGALPGRKVIFTNASVDHANRITERLGVTRHFDGIFDIHQADYLPKPDPLPYDRLVETFDLDCATCVMVEDIARNLAPAAERGMTTCWVRTDSPWASSGGREGDPAAYIHHQTDDLATWLRDLVG
ncbi:MAG: pyrimidine 5'-nucleotidase [Hyphomicrobiales bacterium]|nr:pyrimidine 5'-nucleotidase [Hyphomicrobiales bacterium]